MCDFLGRASETYARAFGVEVRSVAEGLRTFPRLGAVVPEYEQDDVRELPVRNHRLIYRLHGEDIEIVAFVNVSRRLPRTPPG